MAEENKNTVEETEEVIEPTAEAEAEVTEEAAETAEAEETAAEAVEGEVEENETFQRKPKKSKEEEKIEELTDRLQRQMAEFDNFRKRTEREKAAMYDMGASAVVEKMLAVVDNFERGLKGADEADPFVDGMNKIYKQMTTVLGDLGVTPIEAEGKEFDPNLHNAVMHEDNPDVGENIVVMELQKGYMYKESVVRHSMVKVAN
ncbi:MAG: nucleotide exchange factor GrpE [Eubacteriales bacterium]|nr:nucleotide exchange factor GrpE [Eubacteriales bacterium]